MTAYEHWKFEQEEPDLVITHGNYKRKKPVYGWMLQRNVMDKMREELGHDEYMRRVKEDEERNNQLREYLND
jgi:hypothetical protein